MAIEKTPSGIQVCICDVCQDLGVFRAWIRDPDRPGLPKYCSGRQKHFRWNYKAKEKAAAKRNTGKEINNFKF